MLSVKWKIVIKYVWIMMGAAILAGNIIDLETGDFKFDTQSKTMLKAVGAAATTAGK